MKTKFVNATLLGGFELSCDGNPQTLPSSSNGRSLLAYLLYTYPQNHTRLHLIGQLWPNAPEKRARRALTQALWHIRKATPDLLHVTNQQIELNNEIDWVIDVQRFRETAVSNDLFPLREAIIIYQVDFLPGFYEEWMLLVREQLREQYLHALSQLIQLEKGAGNDRQALATALHLTQADPLRESGHREVMRLYVALNQTQAALKQFEICQQILQDELGVEPEAQTIALTKEIKTRHHQPETPYLPAVKTAVLPPLLQQKTLPLIGRSQERSKLLSHIQAAVQQEGGVVLIEGEAGIGKSRLITEMEKDAEWRGAQVLSGHYMAQDGFLPFVGLHRAFTSGLTPLRREQLQKLVEPVWRQTTAAFAPALIPIHADALPHMKPEEEQRRLQDGCFYLLRAWSQIMPLVIVLEDIHWADSESLQLLTDLLPRLKSLSILVMLTYRGEEIRQNEMLWSQLQALDAVGVRDRLILKTLDEEATQNLIRRSLNLPRDAPQFAHRLYTETKGNPLFVLETLRGLHETGILTQDEHGGWHTAYDDTKAGYDAMPITDVLNDVISERIQRLPEDLRHVLAVTAVLGQEFDYSLLSNVITLSDETLLPHLQSLVQLGFLIEQPEAYQFNHDKIRQAAYDNILSQERQQYHSQIANVLAQRPQTPGAFLANHYEQAGRWADAIKAYAAAAKIAADTHAMPTALANSNQALTILTKHQPFSDEETAVLRFELLTTRQYIFWFLEQTDAQESCLQEMQQLANKLNNPEFQAQTWVHFSFFHTISAQDYDSARQAGQKALSIAQRHQLNIIEAQAWQAIARVNNNQDRHKDSQVALQKAIKIWQEINDAQRTELREAYLLLAQQQIALGDHDGAKISCERLAQVAQKTNDFYALANAHSTLANLASWQGQYETAIQENETALTHIRSLGFRNREAKLLANLSVMYWGLGQYDQTLKHMHESHDLLISGEDSRAISLSWENLATLYREIGQHTLALDAGKKAISLCESLKTIGILVISLSNHVLLQTDVGNLKKAEQIVKKLDALQDQVSEAYYVGMGFYAKGTLNFRQGRWETAVTLFEQAYHSFQEGGYFPFAVPAQSFRALSLLHQGNIASAVEITTQAMNKLTNLDGVEYMPAIYRNHWQIMYTANQILAANKALKTGYDLIQKRAKSLSAPEWQTAYLRNVPENRELVEAFEALQHTHMQYNISATLICQDAPRGRPLRPDEYIAISWTPNLPEDEHIKGKVNRRQHQLLRLLCEAEAQNAIPTRQDLASALNSSPRTIDRDLATLRQQNPNLPPIR